MPATFYKACLKIMGTPPPVGAASAAISSNHDHVMIAPEGAPTHVAFGYYAVGAALAAILPKPSHDPCYV